MRRARLVLLVAMLIATAGLSYCVWPTPWRIWEKDGTQYRMNRFTGETSVWDDEQLRWVP
jgi:hypothetical protein